MPKKRLIYYVLVLLCLADLAYSFAQHMNQPLDGDLPWIVAPADDLRPVLDNPFGLEAILNDSIYLNPNRFFSHASLHHYMRETPLALQSISEPITSVYMAAAIAKTAIQLGLILMLTLIICGGFYWKSSRFWLCVLLVSVLFQTNGYCDYMGIIDSSITYSFFYALPLLLLLIYLRPIFILLSSGRSVDMHPIIKALHFLLLPIVCLSGPLNPGIAMVLLAVIGLAFLFQGFKTVGEGPLVQSFSSFIRSVPKQVYQYLIPLAIFSIYSLYLGKQGSFARESLIPLSDIYANLPHGLWKIVSTKIGPALLVIMVLLNVIFICFKFPGTQSKTIRRACIWIGIFILVYIALLPFGGYRAYRPNTLRFDTLIPVSLALIYLFVLTTLFLLERLTLRRTVYSMLITAVVAIFTFADKPQFDNNDCEQSAFVQIASSQLRTVPLSSDCSVMDWRLFHDPEHSLYRGKALYHWRITDSEKLYYNEP